MTMPSGRKLTVIEQDPTSRTYICLIDTQDIVGYEKMSAKELIAERMVEFTEEFLIKHHKES
jgi:hypothetical protein